MKNNKNIINKNNISYNKLALYNALIATFLITILYLTLPKILNYPINSIDNDFQLEVVGIKYSTQFFILASLIISFIFCFVRFIYKRLYKGTLGSKESILKTRKKCFNLQYIMLLIEVILPTLLSFILLLSFKTTYDLLLRLCILIFSFASLFATASYMIGKPFFSKLLIQTSKIDDTTLDSIKISTPTKLIILTIPLFVCSFVLILLISTTSMTIEKGDLLYKFYKQELIASFDNKTLSVNDIKKILDKFDYKSENDFGLIMNSNNKEIIYKSKDKSISDPIFLATYTEKYYDIQHRTML